MIMMMNDRRSHKEYKVDMEIDYKHSCDNV